MIDIADKIYCNLWEQILNYGNRLRNLFLQIIICGNKLQSVTESVGIDYYLREQNMKKKNIFTMALYGLRSKKQRSIKCNYSSYRP